MISLKDVIERGPDLNNFRNAWNKTQVAKFVSQWSMSFKVLKPLQMYIGIEPGNRGMADSGSQVSHCWEWGGSYRYMRGEGWNEPFGDGLELDTSV